MIGQKFPAVMARLIETIAFDADDTLWHNEDLFAEHHRRYCELLSQFHDAGTVERTLYKTEMRNLPYYGYGIKSFMLSSIETAIELTEGEIRSEELRRILDFGREMLRHPVELIVGAEEAVRSLCSDYRLVLITKGDLLDQERKITVSGLAECFQRIEVVTRKDRLTYERVFERLELEPQRTLMVGNSIKSDVIPVLELGGFGVHVPYQTTWEHERVEKEPDGHPRFYRLETIAALPELVARLNATDKQSAGQAQDYNCSRKG